ncbi:MAG: T9SS type A sorting domain-containing protein, partial [Gemmatimonadota bacterium]
IDDITMWSMVEMGDVNCDMVVDIVDVVFTVNVVLGLETGSYVHWAADFNEDDKVNISDAVHLVNSILNPKRMVSENQGSATVDTRLKEAALSTENEFIISVHSDVPIAAAQFNLTVTEGIAIGDPVLDDQIPPMTLTSNRKEGEVIVVVYNTEGGTISPEEDLILRIPCHTQARPGDIEINGVILVGIDGNMIPVSNVKESSGGVENIPQVYFLFQNYPNPFNPVTTIEYSLPRTSEIRLEVYNTLGQLVKVLADGEQEAGHHTVQWDASDMSSGIYFYRIEAKGTSPKNQVHFRETRRMVLMK